MSEQPKEKFLVEILFNQVHTANKSDGGMYYDTQIARRVYQFEGDNRSVVMQDAKSFMDRTIRHGLELHGGSVLKSIIHPSCILQIGLVDDNLYQKEVEEGLHEITVGPSSPEAVTAGIASDVEFPTEATNIDSAEAS